MANPQGCFSLADISRVTFRYLANAISTMDYAWIITMVLKANISAISRINKREAAGAQRTRTELE